MTEIGLRERKKRQTRELISGVATLLFAQRGFDAVTVAEVAAAAGVSQKTVFNYFPRKEDLLLDRIPDLMDMVTRGVTQRPEGTSVQAAFRAVILGLVADGHPLSGFPGPHHGAFYQIVVDSPALQARVREFVQELEDLLTGLWGEDPLRSRFAAAVTVAAYRSVYVRTATRVLAGEDYIALGAGLAAEYERTFDAVERALSS